MLGDDFSSFMYLSISGNSYKGKLLNIPLKLNKKLMRI